jgi:hypothetical protein
MRVEYSLFTCFATGVSTLQSPLLQPLRAHSLEEANVLSKRTKPRVRNSRILMIFVLVDAPGAPDVTI